MCASRRYRWCSPRDARRVTPDDRLPTLCAFSTNHGGFPVETEITDTCWSSLRCRHKAGQFRSAIWACARTRPSSLVEGGGASRSRDVAHICCRGCSEGSAGGRWQGERKDSNIGSLNASIAAPSRAGGQACHACQRRSLANVSEEQGLEASGLVVYSLAATFLSH